MPLDPQVEKAVRVHIQGIRSFMRDNPKLNRLIVGEEHTNHDIAEALESGVADWSQPPGPPLGPVTILTHPYPNLLQNFAIVELLYSVSLLQTRNNLPYTDGQGVSVSSSSNGPELRQIANEILAQYRQDKLQAKIQLNIQLAWGGGINSDLRAVNNFADYF